jgi:purine-nucleoside phosphorylase
LYEGHDYRAATSPVDALRALGADTVLFTNAVGGLADGLRPGDLVAVDRLAPFAPPGRFRLWPDAPDSVPTDGLLPGCDRTGSYAFVLGPNYETPAEIAALRELGAAVVGMSTAPEVARCRELGLRALVVSCVTNHCSDPEPLTHAHVLEVAARASERLVALLDGWLRSG